MKIIVTICVYNRFNNLQHWMNCWSQCNTGNAELIIIHTGDEIEKFSKLCSENKVRYIHRKNVGFDIGCFQDVCLQRLPQFPNDWQYLLWCTDDCIPMTKDFITPFIDTFKNPKAGAVCMEISPSVSIHIRTTGFCIKKEIASKLSFPADPVTTKQQCYLFEHRGNKQTFYNQIVSMGLIPVMVAPAKTSPLWDMGFWKRLDRQKEHDAIFNPGKKTGDKVLFICPIYHNYPQIISSLICQTHKDWELMLIHDGPCNNGLPDMVQDFNDERIKYSETKQHKGNWGHYIRRDALNEIKDRSDIGFVTVSNPDNYIVPTFIEYMLKGFDKSHTAVAVYCSAMVHSYKAWEVIPCRFQRGFIDSGGVMIKKDVAVEIGWRDTESHSSDWTFFSDIAAKYSAQNFIKVPGALLVHN